MLWSLNPLPKIPIYMKDSHGELQLLILKVIPLFLEITNKPISLWISAWLIVIESIFTVIVFPSVYLTTPYYLMFLHHVCYLFTCLTCLILLIGATLFDEFMPIYLLIECFILLFHCLFCSLSPFMILWLFTLGSPTSNYHNFEDW